MKTEFRKAAMPGELRSLMAFDGRIFPAADRFDAEYWSMCEAWWLVVSGVKIGCCAFEKGGEAKGSLYISTTGILPKYRGLGYGRLMKAWQIAYARRHGFRRLVTHTRQSNAAMIALNERFGFRIVRTTPRYYDEPPESAVFMELKLKPAE
jgi:ribosomal protein S18 acetylase RimI-like enzyme